MLHVRRAGSINFQPSKSGIPAANICRTPPCFLKSRRERLMAQERAASRERRWARGRPPAPARPPSREIRACPGSGTGRGRRRLRRALGAVSSGGDAARRAGKKEPVLRGALEEPLPRSCRRLRQSPERCLCLPFPGQRRRGAERRRSPGRYQVVPHPPPPLPTLPPLSRCVGPLCPCDPVGAAGAGVGAASRGRGRQTPAGGSCEGRAKGV